MIFKNRNNQLRSGWKIAGVIGTNVAIEFILMIIFGVVAGIYFAAVNKGITPAEVKNQVNYFMTNSPYGLLMINVLGFICVLLAIFIFLKKVDKKNFKDIGLISMKKAHIEFIKGLLFGILSISFVFAMLLGTKNIEVINPLKPNFSMYSLIGLIIYIIVGIKEELLSRGYCITALNQMKKPWLSVIISSCIFSALHLLNPNVKPLGLINIILVGILFGFMYIKTGNLWMPIGYHITWNYFQGCVYGLNVSGFNIQGIFTCNILQDNILTGGAFGPEAGILTTIVIILGYFLVWKMPKNNKNPYKL